jgi:hypothetical protein
MTSKTNPDSDPYPTPSAKLNWQWLMNSGLTYFSWGFHTSIALVKTIRYPKEPSKAYYMAIYMADGPIEIIETFFIRELTEWYTMMRTLTEWNYHSLNLCPLVKIAMEDDA